MLIFHRYVKLPEGKFRYHMPLVPRFMLVSHQQVFRYPMKSHRKSQNLSLQVCEFVRLHGLPMTLDLRPKKPQATLNYTEIRS